MAPDGEASYLTSIIQQLAGSNLLVVLSLEDNRCRRVSAMVSESLSPKSGSSAEILQLGFGRRVRELHTEKNVG